MNPKPQCSIEELLLASMCLFWSGLATPVELKLKLIPMLQYMHHDAALASRSRELLQELVSSYPSTPMVIVTLHTFTQLSLSALIHIPKQVCLNLPPLLLHSRIIHRYTLLDLGHSLEAV